MAILSIDPILSLDYYRLIGQILGMMGLPSTKPPLRRHLQGVQRSIDEAVKPFRDASRLLELMRKPMIGLQASDMTLTPIRHLLVTKRVEQISAYSN
jgi:hypothetical protein